jgi:hypothetical protein
MDGHIQEEAHDKMDTKNGNWSSTTLREAQKPLEEGLFIE